MDLRKRVVMAKLKKVVIKIHDDGAVELVHQDAGVAVVIQCPDDSEINMHKGDKKIWDGGGRLGGV